MTTSPIPRRDVPYRSRPAGAAALALAVAVMLLTAARVDRAATEYWASGSNGVSAAWSTASNWSTSATTYAPAAAPPGALSGDTSVDIADFNAVSEFTTIVTDHSRNIGGITFDSTASPYIVGATNGNVLTLSAGGQIQIAGAYTANGTETINAPLTLEGNYTFADNAAGANDNLSFGAPIEAGSAGAQILTIAGVGETTVHSVIGGGSGVIQLLKEGAGTLALDANNTFTGGVTIDAGTVLVGIGGALNSTAPNAVAFSSGGTLTLNGESITISSLAAISSGSTVQDDNATAATLTVNTALSSIYAGLLQNGGAAKSGALAFIKAGAGYLALTNPAVGGNTFTGGATIEGGIMNFTTGALGPTTSSTIALDGSITLDSGGTLQYAPGNTDDISSRIIVDGGAVDTGGNTVGWASAMTATNWTGNLTKVGAGVLDISGANTGLPTYGSNTGSAIGIAGGVLELDFSTHAGSLSSKLPAGQALSIVNGTLLLNGAAKTASSQGFSNSTSTTTGVSLNAVPGGDAEIMLLNNGAAIALELTNFNQIGSTPGQFYSFILPGKGTDGNPGSNSDQTSTNGILTSTLNTNFAAADGQQTILSGRTVVNGDTWAVTSDSAGTNNITGLTNYSTEFELAADVDAVTGTTVVFPNTINSLRFNTAGAYALDPIGNIIIASGGILETANVGAHAVTLDTAGTTDTITSGNGADLVVVQNNTAGVMTINSTITDDTGGPTSMTIALTKVGPGTVLLTNAANSYSGNATGGTFISGGFSASGAPIVGDLQIPADAKLDTAGHTYLGAVPATFAANDIVLTDGVLQFAAGTATMTLSAERGIALNGMGGGIDTDGNTLNYGGAISNYSENPGQSGDFSKLGLGTLFLTGANTYSGQTFITAGTLNINADAALGATTAGITFNGVGTLQLATKFTGTSLSAGRLITVDAGDSGTIDTNGAASITWGGTLTNDGTFTKAGVGVFEIDSPPILASGSVLAVSGGTLRLNHLVPAAIGSGVSVSVASGATFELAGGTSELTQGVNIANAGELLVSSAVNQNVGVVSAGGATVVNAGASLTAYQIQQSSLTIHGSATSTGRVTLSPSGSGSIGNPQGPNNTSFSSTLTTLSIDNNGAALGSRVYFGALDIGNNGLVIAYGSLADPFMTIEDMVRSGYNLGSWTGTGITSTLAAASTGTNAPLNIGLEDFTPGANGFGSSITFEGQTVTTSAVLLRLTYMDDIILAGQMDQEDADNDALRFAANYGIGTVWTTGAITHDSVAGPNDAILFASNFSTTLPSLDGTTGVDVSSAFAAPVPEPNAMLLLVLGFLAPAFCGPLGPRLCLGRHCRHGSAVSSTPEAEPRNESRKWPRLTPRTLGH